MTDAQDVEPQAHPTILTGRKEDISFEMWVEVDGKPLEVYGEAEMESGGSEAWIASEIGKPYIICVRVIQESTRPSPSTVAPIASRAFQDFRAAFYCDGQQIQKKVFSKKKFGGKIVCEGRYVSGNQMQPMQFSSPTLVEDDSAGQNFEKLGMIEVVFFRGKRSNVRPSVATNAKLHVDSATGGKISERAKKGEGFMLGAVTAFGEAVPAKEYNEVDFAAHPNDRKQGFFRMSFRYGPADLLRAQGHIPQHDAPGTSKRKAITFDDAGDKENEKNGLDRQLKKDFGAQQVSKKSELDKIQERHEVPEDIVDVKPKVEVLENHMAPRHNSQAGSFDKEETEMIPDKRSAKKERIA